MTMHSNVAKGVSLLGFAILGICAGALISPLLGLAGLLFQICKVVILLVKGICGRSEIRDEEILSDFDSPAKSPYRSLASSSQQL